MTRPLIVMFYGSQKEVKRERKKKMAESKTLEQRESGQQCTVNKRIKVCVKSSKTRVHFQLFVQFELQSFSTIFKGPGHKNCA